MWKVTKLFKLWKWNPSRQLYLIIEFWIASSYQLNHHLLKIFREFAKVHILATNIAVCSHLVTENRINLRQKMTGGSPPGTAGQEGVGGNWLQLLKKTPKLKLLNLLKVQSYQSNSGCVSVGPRKRRRRPRPAPLSIAQVISYILFIWTYCNTE